MLTLRDYQADIADRADDAIARKSNWVYQAATGAGKTRILAEITRRFAGRICVLAHRDELIEQLRGTISEHTGERVGIERAKTRSDDERIVVCSIMTVGRTTGLHRLPKADLVLTDEVHHAVSKSYRNIKQHYGDVPWGGCTATLRRSDGISLRDMFDEVIADIPINWLINHDYLVPIDAKRINVSESLDSVKVRGEDFIAAELGRIVNTPAINNMAIDYYLSNYSDRQFLAFVPTVQHAHDLAALMEAKGLRVRAVDGTTPDGYRKETNRLIRSGRLHGLINVGVYTEGTDFPSISCLLMLRPTKSPLLATQMLGRGLRTCDFSDWTRPLHGLKQEKTDCVVVDMVYACRHSLIHPPSISGKPVSDKDKAASRRRERVIAKELPQVSIPIATFESFDPFMSTSETVEDYQWQHTYNGWEVTLPDGSHVLVTAKLEVIGLGEREQFTSSLAAFKFADDIIEQHIKAWSWDWEEDTWEDSQDEPDDLDGDPLDEWLSSLREEWYSIPI